MKSALAILVIASVITTPAAADSREQEVVTYLVQQQVLPAHARWQQSSNAFRLAAERFCSGKSRLADTQAAWRDAQHAWVALQPSLVSLPVRNTIGMQAAFWPDKRNLSGSQTEALLASGQPVTLQSLGKSSVVVRGLSASEYLLFDKQHNPAASARRQQICPLLQANAAYQNALALQALLLLQQDNVADRLTTVPNEQYADIHGPLAELLRVHVTALAVMLKKLGTAIGQPGDGAPQLYQAEAWRAGDTLGSLQAGIAASRALWEGSGWRTLVAPLDEDLALSVDQTYASLAAQLPAPPASLETLLASAEGKQQLKDIYQHLMVLHLLYERQLAKVLGVSLGFNGTDGD